MSCGCGGKGGHYDHTPPLQRCYSLRNRQIEPQSPTTCYHVHNQPPSPRYYTTYDVNPGPSCCYYAMNDGTSVYQSPVNIHSSHHHGMYGSPTHHCGSCRHLPVVASPLHFTNSPVGPSTPQRIHYDTQPLRFKMATHLGSVSDPLTSPLQQHGYPLVQLTPTTSDDKRSVHIGGLSAQVLPHVPSTPPSQHGQGSHGQFIPQATSEGSSSAYLSDISDHLSLRVSSLSSLSLQQSALSPPPQEAEDRRSGHFSGQSDPVPNMPLQQHRHGTSPIPPSTPPQHRQGSGRKRRRSARLSGQLDPIPTPAPQGGRQTSPVVQKPASGREDDVRRSARLCRISDPVPDPLHQHELETRCSASTQLPPTNEDDDMRKFASVSGPSAEVPSTLPQQHSQESGSSRRKRRSAHLIDEVSNTPAQDTPGTSPVPNPPLQQGQECSSPLIEIPASKSEVNSSSLLDSGVSDQAHVHTPTTLQDGRESDVVVLDSLPACKSEHDVKGFAHLHVPSTPPQPGQGSSLSRRKSKRPTRRSKESDPKPTVPPQPADRSEEKTIACSLDQEDVPSTQPPDSQESSQPPPISKSEDRPKSSVVLHSWSFTVLHDGTVLLYGLKDSTGSSSDKHWRSGPVAERITRNTLTTRSGTIYHLMGGINWEEMGKNSIWSTVTGRKVLKKFKMGFPSDWSLLLQELEMDHTSQQDTKPVVAKQETPQGTPMLKSIKTEPQATPTIDANFLSSLKRSSRGRVIKPVLSDFESPNLTYSYDMFGGFKGVYSPVIDLTLDEEEREKPLTEGVTIKKEEEVELEEECLPVKRSRKKNQEEAPVKRQKKRGRPAKSLSCAVADSGGVTSTTPDKAKRKRRRKSRLIPTSLVRKSKLVEVSDADWTPPDTAGERPAAPEDREISESIPSETVRPVGLGKKPEPVDVAVRGEVKEKQKSVKMDADKRQTWQTKLPRDTGLETASWSDVHLDREGCEWTPSVIRRLKRTVHGVPALTTNFWEVVALKLGTGHTARECSTQYQDNPKIKPRKQERAMKQNKNSTGGDTIVITAKPGTMKRKRQLRNALEQRDKGYSDDIFDATPYKKKLKSVQIDMSDDEWFDDLEEEEGKGPDTRYTPNEARRRVGAPSTHTPKLCDYLTTPDLKSGLKRDAADSVMYKIQKAKKVKKPAAKNKQSTKANPGRKQSKSNILLSVDHLRKIRSSEQTALHLIEDSDDDDNSSEDSDPFSDLEEYQDIVKQLH